MSTELTIEQVLTPERLQSIEALRDDPVKYNEAVRALTAWAGPRIFAKYRNDPRGYAKNVLGAALTDDEAEILESVRDNRRTLVKAAHSVGKTFTAGILANWWFDCWTEHICYITAPTWPQALGLTFKECKRQRQENSLPGRILETGRVLDLDDLKATIHYIKALNAEKSEGFQGEHSAAILIIIEEGPGVPLYIWEAAEGLMTSADCRLFVIGNPTDEATEFGKAASSPGYNVISISGLNHVNIKAQMAGKPAPIPKAIDLLWLYEKLKDECEHVDTLTGHAFEWHALPEIQKALEGKPADLSQKWYYLPNAYFQGRALGIFPTQADQQVIPKAWLASPVLMWLETDDPEMGVDIARFGDDRTTIFARRGPCVLRGREVRKMDTVEVETAIKDEAKAVAKLWKPDAADPVAVAKTIKIKIDVTGGLGAGPYDHLKAEGYRVIAVNSSATAKDTEQYKNVRSELWFDVRVRAHERRLDLSRLPKEMRVRLERELSAPKYKAPGQKIVEDKSVTKGRLGESPDLADGHNLAFYQARDLGGFGVAQLRF